MNTKLPPWHSLSYVCDDCAERYGRSFAKGHLATMNILPCSCCGEVKTVTEPRDYALYDKTKDQSL